MAPEYLVRISDGEPAVRDDVLSALVNLGYHRPLAEKAVLSALKALPGGGFESTLKQALRERIQSRLEAGE